jgi:hypothetical protein
MSSLKFLGVVLAAALLLFSPVTYSATWFAVEDQNSSDNQIEMTVEVDLDSLHSRGEERELLTRISYAQPRQKQGITFQSVLANLAVSCGSGVAVWKNASYFSSVNAEGAALSSDNFGLDGLPSGRLNLLPEKVWAILQKSACNTAATAAP